MASRSSRSPWTWRHQEDPAAGLTAFNAGVPRAIDYCTVGCRLFVNHVSLGVYTTVVQEDSLSRGRSAGPEGSASPI